MNIKDSGEREAFDGGMVRDTEAGKVDYTNLYQHFEPMGTRYAEHMTAGRVKYEDLLPGVPNWTATPITYEARERFTRSASRHFKQWLRGDRDEDHAAAVMFNINGAEFVDERLASDSYTIEDAYQAGVADGRMEEAYDRDSKEPATTSELSAFEKGLTIGHGAGRADGKAAAEADTLKDDPIIQGIHEFATLFLGDPLAKNMDFELPYEDVLDADETPKDHFPSKAYMDRWEAEHKPLGDANRVIVVEGPEEVLPRKTMDTWGYDGGSTQPRDFFKADDDLSAD